MQTRGFNQVIGLLREVPYQSILGTRASSKVAQSSKTKEERLLQLSNHLYLNLQKK